MIRIGFSGAFALLACVVTQHSIAQETDTLLISGNPVASFTRAGSVAVSPDGLIYVTDRDRDRILVYSSAGKLIRQLGGPGTNEGQFDDPTDIDPGIGLVISIADSQNGRIQRFSKEFRFLESLPVAAYTGNQVDQNDPSFRVGAAQLLQSAPGRPIAVTSSASDDLYVVDEQAGVVIRWDRDRRNRWIIGDQGVSEGRLVEPIDVVATSDLLFVADRVCSCVFVYDLFGTFIRTIAPGRFPTIRSIERSGDGILVTTADRIVQFDRRGTQIRDTIVHISGDLINAVLLNGQYILLTETELYLYPSSRQ